MTVSLNKSLINNNNIPSKSRSWGSRKVLKFIIDKYVAKILPDISWLRMIQKWAFVMKIVVPMQWKTS